MEPIDDKTLGRIADLICDTNGPNHRQGWELPQFFRHAGWPDVPEYDNIGRKRWVLDLLRAKRDDKRATEQVLCRLCDPREYQEESRRAQQVAQALNRVLALEGLKVTYSSGRPIVVELPGAMISPDTPAALNLKRELGAFIFDQQLAAILRLRLDEASTCREHGASLAAIILLGSILEGALLDVATRFVSSAMRSSRAPEGRKLSSWSLVELIDVAHERGWIQPDVRAFAHVLRDYRNFVHPWEQRRRGEFPDHDTVNVCWEVVIAALNDLGAAVAAEGAQ